MELSQNLMEATKCTGTVFGIVGAIIVAFNRPFSGVGFILFLISFITWYNAGVKIKETSTALFKVTLIAIKALGTFYLFLLIVLFVLPAYADITGMPRVIDGDTIIVSGERIRLHGIDSPETRQTCMKGGKAWNCGGAATAALLNRIGGQPVTCKGDKRDRYKRLIGICYIGMVNLNAWMVQNGWALAYRRYSRDYIGDEGGAMDERKGIWRGQFTKPWEWRRLQFKNK
jgi:endonuclease YncB( thermonuclease family)